MIQNRKVYINDYAKRCFRDIADEDYIAARILYKNKSLSQFLILANQSLEKYLKGILLFNEVSTKVGNGSTHDLNILLKKCDDNIQHFNIEDRTRKIISVLNGIDQTRYLAYSFFGKSEYFLDLDPAVFDLRKFCHSDIEKAKSFSSIPSSDLRKNKRIVFGGYLEKILKNPQKFKEQYQGLTWKNFYYGKNQKKSILFGASFWSKNSPVSVKEDRDIYNLMKEFVYFPKAIKNFFEHNNKKPDQLKSDSDIFKELLN